MLSFIKWSKISYKKYKKAKTFQLQIFKYKSNIDYCLWNGSVVAISRIVSSNGSIDTHIFLTASYHNSYLISKIFLIFKIGWSNIDWKFLKVSTFFSELLKKLYVSLIKVSIYLQKATCFWVELQANANLQCVMKKMAVHFQIFF